MANSATVKIEGMSELSAVLNGIPSELRAEVLATAVKAAAAPMVRAAKRFASNSVDTGALRKSIGFIVRKYKKGATAVSVVGPRRGYYRNGKKLGKAANRKGADSPSHYAHLVEYGHYSRAATGEKVSSSKGTTRRLGTFKANSFVLGKPFIRPALASSKADVKSALIQGIGKGIEKARAKLVKKGLHKA